MKTAQVLMYDGAKGYGFLVERNNARHFFHISNFIGFVPQPGMAVTFEIGQGRKGPAAFNVQLTPAAPVMPDVNAAGLLAGDTSKSEVA